MKRILKKLLIGLLILVLVFAGGFAVYVSDYYRAQPAALAVLNEPGVSAEPGHWLIAPEVPGSTALVFYPGGKVAPQSYLPLLKAVAREAGITCILVDMPFNLAVFDVNAADRIIARYPAYTRWLLGGHSLGGAMAGSYASAHRESIAGLVLLGAYRYGDFPEERTLTVYGSLDQVRDQITDTRNVVRIEGGNHAQFGSYGPQKGDAAALISADDQRQQAVQAITDFISRLD